MIKAIFFATFDVHEGPKVHYQVPPNSVQPSSTSAAIPLFNFRPLANYIIPALALSNRPLQLLTPTKPHHRILSHPVTIQGEQYARNAFTFNFCLVLEEETGFHSYLPVVSKLANLFRHLEEQGRFLSTELAHLHPNDNNSNNGGGLFSNSKRSSYGLIRAEDPGSATPASDSSSRIHAICEILLEDLNNYSECMIPITSTTTTLNIKLFPIYPPPPPLSPHQVPLLTVSLTDMIDPATWDITLLRILPYINGVNSVKRIALVSDTDLKLVRKAVRELLYYGCASLLDIFSFGAIYAGTPALAQFVAGEDEEARTMREECLRYVAVPVLAGAPATSPISHHHRPFSTTGRPGGGGPSLLSSTLGHTPTTTTSPTAAIPIRPIALKNPIPSPPSTSTSPYPHYTPHPSNSSLPPHPTNPAATLNATNLSTLYLTLTPSLPLRAWLESQSSELINQIDVRRFITFGVIKGLLYRVHRYPFSARAVRRVERAGRGGKRGSVSVSAGGGGGGGGGSIGNGGAGDEEDELAPFLDGTHSFDEICTELMISERELVGRLREGWGGDVVVVNR
ncbi:MAG: Nitrogen permease regulator 2 [Ramalina farinacea]|uniref:Nitrogen permease regulator 2 n=1 Tax=Ramalina farinacea TaxID=258253 RepID=A0AA43TWC3_9LECA|nr:Nitrogen permease regulator 2 [Ramalina farinacea]